jgi:hypothetical protein
MILYLIYDTVIRNADEDIVSSDLRYVQKWEGDCFEFQ